MNHSDRWNSGVGSTRYYEPPARPLKWVLRGGHWKFITFIEWSRNWTDSKIDPFAISTSKKARPALVNIRISG